MLSIDYISCFTWMEVENKTRLKYQTLAVFLQRFWNPKKVPLINLMSYRTSLYTFVEKYKNHKLVQNFLLTMYHEWLLHIELKGEFESNHQCQLPIHTIWRIFFCEVSKVADSWSSGRRTNFSRFSRRREFLPV